jgi:adenylate cyclase
MLERKGAILVVDDNDDNRYTLTGRLKREGYADVAIACDGAEALRRLAESPFDLVLLDVMMPVLDGIETLAAMKGNPALRDIPVMMISAATDLERVVRCIELGAEDYLPKPFNPVLLRARVGSCLEKKRLRDQEQAHLAVIETERSRLTDLLHAILPAAAVVELQATGAVQPQRHGEVAVLYCDVSGFTAYCDSHPPELAVTNLQHLVEKFEALTEAAGLEKLKTVGDALIATAGLLTPHPDPVAAALECGFAVIEAALAGPAEWKLRCGLHIGPVVAGIVGKRKFSFDIWGDTINVAARLAGVDQTGCVHLSEAAWRRVAARWNCEAVGLVALRGKGEVPVFRCPPGLRAH